MDKPQLTQLHIKNYRSLADIKLDLDDLTVLVGINGSGKSNLLDALRFTRDALQGRLDQAIAKRGGMSAIRRWSPKGRPFDIHFTFHIKSEKWTGQYSFTLGSERRGEFRVKREACHVELGHRHYHYEIKNGTWVTKPQVAPTLFEAASQSPGAPSPQEIKQRMTVIADDALYLPQAALLLGEPAYALVWDWFRNVGLYNIYPNTFREPQKPIRPYPLEDDGRNLVSLLRTLGKKRKGEEGADAIHHIQEFLQAAVPGIEEISVKQVGSYLVGQLHHVQTTSTSKRRRAAFDLAQESDGTLRLLALFTALFQYPPRSLLAIEEPELNIHPGALAVLKDAIQISAQHSQIILTTHSPDLLNMLPVQAFRVVEMQEGKTKIAPLAAYQREAIRQALFSPGELIVSEGLQAEDIHD